MIAEIPNWLKVPGMIVLALVAICFYQALRSQR